MNGLIQKQMKLYMLGKAVTKNKPYKGYKCEYANQQPSTNLND